MSERAPMGNYRSHDDGDTVIGSLKYRSTQKRLLAVRTLPLEEATKYDQVHVFRHVLDVPEASAAKVDVDQFFVGCGRVRWLRQDGRAAENAQADALQRFSSIGGDIVKGRSSGKQVCNGE